MAGTRASLFDTLTALADEIPGIKQASARNKGRVKTAEASPPDPGGYQGKSTHPSADAPNSGQPAKEGERSAENTADVKADQGPPSVDSTAPNTVGDQDKQQLNIGTNQSATGDDPAVEDDYKDKDRKSVV